MVNFVMSMNLILLLFLIYSEKGHCLLKAKNIYINDNGFLEAINRTEMTNKILNQNIAGANLFSKFIDIEKKISNTNNDKTNQKNLLNENLNLRETLKFEYLNLTANEMDQLSFIETNLNAQESEFFNYKTKPFTWTNVTVAGKKPAPRKDYSVILADSYLVFFGGCSQNNDFYDDLYFFDILGQTWLEIKQKGKIPSARCGHIAKLYGSVMWMFGGYSREGHLNDLYSLNLETREWKQHYFNGDSPVARSNHGAVVDDSANIYIFGGYSEKGYLNDLFYIDTINERYQKVKFSGNPPTPREDFAMTLINKRIFIFGGFQEGGVLNDIFTIDLITFIWDILKPEGTSPSPRQGMGVERFGKKIIISGGCDHRKHTCFSDSFILDTETMWWSNLENNHPLIEKSGFDLIFHRGNVFTFGGCQLAKNCTNDLISLNVDEICPNDCSDNGSCIENIGCICKTGFVSNDCSISIKCKNDCGGNGICHNNGKCGCFPGWFGSTCESKINCSKNCTSFDNGVCQSNGKCLCKDGFEGEDCSGYVILGKKAYLITNEPLNSLARLNFNELKSSRISDKNINGTLSSSLSSNDKNAVNESSLRENKTGIISKKAFKFNVTKNADAFLSKETSTNQLKNQKAKTFRKESNKNKVKPGEESDEGGDSKDEKDDDSEDEKPSFYMLNGVKYIPTNNCTNNCSKQGMCLNNVCLCEPGFTTEDCSMTIRKYKKQGFNFNDILVFLIIIMLIAMIIRIIMFMQEKSTKSYDNYLNIE